MLTEEWKLKKRMEAKNTISILLMERLDIFQGLITTDSFMIQFMVCKLKCRGIEHFNPLKHDHQTINHNICLTDGYRKL